MTKVAEPKETGQSVRSLPIHLWPSTERRAWEDACRPNVRLKRGGAASHMRPVTQSILAKRCGYFLDFLSRSGQLDMNATAGAQVTPDNVEAYVGELKGRVSSVTAYGSIQKLRRFVQLVAPHRKLEWLIAIERQLFSEMRPQSKRDRVPYVEVLVDAGLKLMAEAEVAERPKLTRARIFRDGLMIALRAYCPMRLKNHAALEIGRSFVNVDGTWWIVLTAAETKEKRPDERPVPEELADPIKRYLEIYRSILARGNTSNALWMAINGKPMSYASMGELITKTTEMTVGVKVSSHLFRDAGVTTLATRAGDKPHAGSALLSHRPESSATQENYNQASSVTAGRYLMAVNQHYRRSRE
jgi:integrase